MARRVTQRLQNRPFALRSRVRGEMNQPRGVRPIHIRTRAIVARCRNEAEGPASPATSPGSETALSGHRQLRAARRTIPQEMRNAGLAVRLDIRPQFRQQRGAWSGRAARRVALPPARAFRVSCRHGRDARPNAEVVALSCWWSHGWVSRLPPPVPGRIVRRVLRASAPPAGMGGAVRRRHVPAGVPRAALLSSVVATAFSARRSQLWRVCCFASDGGAGVVRFDRELRRSPRAGRLQDPAGSCAAPSARPG